jgi:hypothetical protein
MKVIPDKVAGRRVATAEARITDAKHRLLVEARDVRSNYQPGVAGGRSPALFEFGTRFLPPGAPKGT